MSFPLIKPSRSRLIELKPKDKKYLINLFLSTILRKLFISFAGNSILADRPWLLTRTFEKPWLIIHSSANAICLSLFELISSPKGIREAKHGCAGLSHQGKPNDLEIERIDFLSISS